MIVEDKKYVKTVRDNYADEEMFSPDKKPIQTIANRIYDIRDTVCGLEECLRNMESKMFTDTLKLDVESKAPCCSETLDDQLDLIIHHVKICLKIADSLNSRLG